MKRGLLCSILVILAFNAFAAQPVWVVKTMNNIRRAILAYTRHGKTF